MIRVARASLYNSDVREMIAYHQRDMEAMSPPGTSWALDLSGLTGPAVSVLGAWEGETLVGIGALKRLGDGVAELKSMRTHPDHLGKGVAKALLAELIELSRSEGYRRLSLETGTSEEFRPAIGLYTRHGFEVGEAFSEYENGPHNQCYHLDL